jgi:hypothetical protein
VIRDPSAPYDVDVVVLEDRRIASDPDNPLSLLCIGVRVLAEEHTNDLKPGLHEQ